MITRSTYLRVLVVMTVLVVAVGLLMLAGDKPAEAVFPGANGKIAFSSNRDTPNNPERDAEIFSMNPDGTDVALLTATGGFSGSGEDSFPAWSPDGNKIAFHSNRDGNYEIYVIDADPTTNDATNLTNSAASQDEVPTWSPDGTKIAFTRDRQLYVMNADGSSPTDLSVAAYLPAWSPDGQMIAYVDAGTFKIFTIAPDGSSKIQRTKNSASDNFPTWSPDGKKLAFVSNLNANTDLFDDNTEIYTMRLSGRSPGVMLTKLTNSPEPEGRPAWSPDGTKITFARSHVGDFPGNLEIFTMNANGSNQVNVTNSEFTDYAPDWQRR